MKNLSLSEYFVQNITRNKCSSFQNYERCHVTDRIEIWGLQSRSILQSNEITRSNSDSNKSGCFDCLSIGQNKLLWACFHQSQAHRATLKEEETMSNTDNKAISKVTVTRQPLSLSMCRLNKARQTLDSHYKAKSQRCGNVDEKG